MEALTHAHHIYAIKHTPILFCNVLCKRAQNCTRLCPHRPLRALGQMPRFVHLRLYTRACKVLISSKISACVRVLRHIFIQWHALADNRTHTHAHTYTQTLTSRLSIHHLSNGANVLKDTAIWHTHKLTHMCTHNKLPGAWKSRGRTARVAPCARPSPRRENSSTFPSPLD